MRHDLRLAMALLSRLAEVERRVAGGEFRGRVHAVDATRHLAQVVIGATPEGEPVLSPWLPVAQTAGALKIHDLPSVGQQVSVQSAAGDIAQGRIVPLHWSEGHDAPSNDPDLKVLTLGDVRVELSSDAIEITIGAARYRLDAHKFAVLVDEVAFVGSALSHNQTNVGDTHMHTDVMPGGALTGPPTG